MSEVLITKLKGEVINNNLTPMGWWSFYIAPRDTVFSFRINMSNCILKIIGDAVFLDENEQSLGKQIQLPSGWNNSTVRVSPSNSEIKLNLSSRYGELNGLYWSESMGKYVKMDLSDFKYMQGGAPASAVFTTLANKNNNIMGSLQDFGCRFSEFWLYNDVIGGDFAEFAQNYPWKANISTLELGSKVENFNLNLINAISSLTRIGLASNTIGSFNNLGECQQLIYIDMLEDNSNLEGSLEELVATRLSSLTTPAAGWFKITNYKLLENVTYNDIPLSLTTEFPYESAVTFDYDIQGNISIRN